MNEFDRIWLGGVEALPRHLGQDVAALQETTQSLRQISFPGALSVLGVRAGPGAPAGDLLQGLVGEVSADGTVRARGLDPSAVEQVFVELFVRGRRPSQVLADEELRRRLIQLAVGAVARRAGPVSPEEAARILELLETGEFLRDLAGTTAAVAQVLPRLPLDVLRDLPTTPFRVAGLTLALLRDLGESLRDIPSVVADLADGSLDHPPGVLPHTLRWLYGFAGVRTVARTIRTIIGPDNESVRLALLLYARVNGIPLEEEHLDLLSQHVFDAESPDLGPALAAGIGLLAARYGAAALPRLLRRLELAPATG